MVEQQVDIRFSFFIITQIVVMRKILYILVNEELYLQFQQQAFFLARLFWNASRANHSEFQPCFRLAKSMAGLETIFLFFSETNRSFEEKLHGVCTLTKVYQYAKEERFLFFGPCRTLVDICTELLLKCVKKFCNKLYWIGWTDSYSCFVFCHKGGEI